MESTTEEKEEDAVITLILLFLKCDETILDFSSDGVKGDNGEVKSTEFFSRWCRSAEDEEDFSSSTSTAMGKPVFNSSKKGPSQNAPNSLKEGAKPHGGGFRSPVHVLLSVVVVALWSLLERLCSCCC